jgi:hypothetical protein
LNPAGVAFVQETPPSFDTATAPSPPPKPLDVPTATQCETVGHEIPATESPWPKTPEGNDSYGDHVTRSVVTSTPHPVGPSAIETQCVDPGVHDIAAASLAGIDHPDGNDTAVHGAVVASAA